MWICHSNAFLSIVADRNDPDNLLVRARMPGHIEALFPKAKVFTDAGSDYFYRAFITRTEVVDVVAAEVASIRYDNFKSSVKDDILHDAYMKFWQVMYAVQKLAKWSDKKAKTIPITTIRRTREHLSID